LKDIIILLWYTALTKSYNVLFISCVCTGGSLMSNSLHHASRIYINDVLITMKITVYNVCVQSCNAIKSNSNSK